MLARSIGVAGISEGNAYRSNIIHNNVMLMANLTIRIHKCINIYIYTYIYIYIYIDIHFQRRHSNTVGSEERVVSERS